MNSIDVYFKLFSFLKLEFISIFPFQFTWIARRMNANSFQIEEYS